jgi:hypothetical protein
MCIHDRPVRGIKDNACDGTGSRSLTEDDARQHKHCGHGDAKSSQRSGLHTLVSEMSLQNLVLH